LMLLPMRSPLPAAGIIAAAFMSHASPYKKSRPD
jgi:hypothetical protein